MSSERLQIGSSTQSPDVMTTFGMNSPLLSSRRDVVLVPAKSEVRFEHGKILLQIEAIEWPQPHPVPKKGGCAFPN